MVSFDRFIAQDYQLTGDLIEVPHLGPVAVERLGQHEITSTWQLIAYFLDCGRDEDVFKKFLDSCDAPETHTARIARAIATRVSDVGIKVQVQLPAHVVQSSRITDDQMDVFLRRVFTGVLNEDFQGFGLGKPGQPAASVANLARAGITTTDGLFAAFLKKLDGPIDANSAAKAAEFYTELKDKERYGVAPGYAATIVDAIKAQLDIGLDRRPPPPGQPERRREIDAIVEEPPEPPGTDEQVRRRPAAIGAGAGRGERPVQPRVPASVESGGGNMLGTMLLCAALAVAAYCGYCALQQKSRELVVY